MPKSINTDQKARAREALRKTQGMVCYFCGVNLLDPQPVMMQSESMKTVTVEHLQPLSRGGSNDLSNLRLACLKCNMSKGNKTVEEYKKYLDVRK